jgi:hypothetical protein
MKNLCDLCVKSINILSYVIMWLSLAVFLAKSLWNFGVPYAMIHEALRRPENKHGWSLFILLDIGLLGLAVLSSALAGDYRTIGPRTLVVYGLGSIVLSYINMYIVLLTGGYIFGLFPKNGPPKGGARGQT